MESHRTGLSSSAGFNGFICTLFIDVINYRHHLSSPFIIRIYFLVAVVFDRFPNLHYGSVVDTPDPLGWRSGHPLDQSNLRNIVILLVRKLHEQGISPDDAPAIQCINREAVALTGHG